MENLGRILVILGLIIALALGIPILDLGNQFSFLGWILAVIGAVWGYMNISRAQTSGFLIVGLGLWTSSAALNALPVLGSVITGIMGSVGVFVTGAMLAVVIKALIDYIKD